MGTEGGKGYSGVGGGGGWGFGQKGLGFLECQSGGAALLLYTSSRGHCLDKFDPPNVVGQLTYHSEA